METIVRVCLGSGPGGAEDRRDDMVKLLKDRMVCVWIFCLRLS